MEQLSLFNEPDPYPATPFDEVVGSQPRYVRRIRPPVKAHGGKYYLARRIVPILLTAPGSPTEYLEPCAFGGSVFLSLPRFEHEILGDVNPDVVHLWRLLARHNTAEALRVQLWGTTYNERTFLEAREATPESTIGTIQQPINFMIRSRFSRGGLGHTFAWSDRLRGGKPGDLHSWDTFCSDSLPMIIERTYGVEVVDDPCWWTVWESRDRVQRLIYADPSYMRETRTSKDAYGPFEMTRMHHFWLVSALRAHSGPAAISGYRSGDYDRWLKDWRRIDFDMPNNSGQRLNKKGNKQRRIESLWINW